MRIFWADLDIDAVAQLARNGEKDLKATIDLLTAWLKSVK